MPVDIGAVKTLSGAQADKAQALKILEEAAEVFSAWEEWEHDNHSRLCRFVILNECADLITAACGMIAALGVEDFTPDMRLCAESNEERGREMV